MNDKLRCCCFFGHRKIEKTDSIKNTVRTAVKNLIENNGVDTFLFGSKSQFNTLCYEIVTELKSKYPQIQRIYIRAEFPYIDNSYRNYLLKHFEDTYYPEKIIGSGKAVYIERNYEMINKSKYCIVYYDEHYTPLKIKKPNKHKPKSGTKIAYEYAVKRCVLINTKLL